MARYALNSQSEAPWWLAIGHATFPVRCETVPFPLEPGAQARLGVAELTGSLLVCEVYLCDGTQEQGRRQPLRALIDTGSRFCVLFKRSLLNGPLLSEDRLEKADLSPDQTLPENPFYFRLANVYEGECDVYMLEFQIGTGRGQDRSREALKAPVKVLPADARFRFDFLIGTAAFPGRFYIDIRERRETENGKSEFVGVLAVEELTTTMRA